ncbi:uncharacterized protein LOC119091283 isoform X2 [Pollicipes pollicipes]|uniref:uncharacterized protein LOC119091283 isoform X2 n=1 Tax=Pollicipes pollicipes TaxID=41117 RepID=UPI001884989F|nr:uncharacterized protein LOC119091283 isoform X2 [Pollicipes pollicipes]
MARWVPIMCVVLLCVACADVADGTPRRSGRVSRRQERTSRVHHHRHKRHHRSHPPSVPERPASASRAPLSHKQAALERLTDQLLAGYQSDQPSWSSLKRQLASREGVERLRRRGPQRAFAGFMSDAAAGHDHQLFEEALNSLSRINMNHSCSVPAEQLVRVSEEFPSSRLQYLPTSVLLRRCSDHSGCCYDHQTCAARAAVKVQRTVMVLDYVSGPLFLKYPKKLTFAEHTSCHCVDRTASASCPSTFTPALNDDRTTGDRRRTGQSRHSSPASQIRRRECRCPREFVSRPMPDGSCKCDCIDGNTKCIRTKRGQTYIREEQHRCILSGECDPPACAYGKYGRRASRCPRRREKPPARWLKFTV